MNTRTILTALALAAVLTASCAAPSTTEPEVPASALMVVDMALNDYVEWSAENPTGTFEEYKPQAVMRLLGFAGVPVEGDPEDALLAWLGDTPVEARHLRWATVIVLAEPELSDYRMVLAQIYARLELAE